MHEIGPDIHKCEACGANAQQLNIWELDRLEVCKSCLGVGCKLCQGKGVIGEEKAEKKPNKYNNKKKEIDGIIFDSEVEGRFYERLKELAAAERIQKFDLQPKFELQPAFKTPGGHHIRAIYYIADFAVYHNDGTIDIVDVKAMETEAFLLKAKIFKYRYPHLEFSVMAELPKKYQGGPGVFVELAELKRIRKEAANNGQTTKKATPKKTKQAAKSRSKSSKSRNI